MPPIATVTPADESADWLRVPAAAKKLGMKTSTLYRVVKERRVPHRRFPGTSVIGFAPEDIAEIVEMSAVRPLRKSA